MVLKLFNGFVIAEGEFTELAPYTGLLIETMLAVEKERGKREAAMEADSFAEMMNMTFAELMKREQEEKPEESGEGEEE